VPKLGVQAAAFSFVFSYLAVTWLPPNPIAVIKQSNRCSSGVFLVHSLSRLFFESF